MNWAFWLAELETTLKSPQDGARRVIALGLPLGTAWTALILIAVVTAAMGFIGTLSPLLPPDPVTAALMDSPLAAAALQVLIQAMVAILLFAVGRMFGGQGALPDAVALTAWFGVPMLGLQVLQVILVFVAPLMAILLGLFGVGLTFYLLSHFACALHGFKSPLRAFGVILGTSIVVGMVFLTLLMNLGLMGELPNV